MSSPGEIGERIRVARQERRITQEELASAVGVSRSAVAQWETGRSGQVTGNLARIAQVLGVGVEFLMHGSGPNALPEATTADEAAMLRLYRDCSQEDRQLLLRTAVRLARKA